MEISDDLLSLFSASVDEQPDSYVIEIPKRELTVGEIRPGEVYRVAVLATETAAEADQSPEREQVEQETPQPPVVEGDRRTVDIEDIGEQGDGIARVERGYVIIVPKTEQGERVTIEITDVRENVAFGEIVERNPSAT